MLANSADGGHARGVADKTTVDSLVAHAQHCAPRIVLRLGAPSNAGDADANSQREQQESYCLQMPNAAPLFTVLRLL